MTQNQIATLRAVAARSPFGAPVAFIGSMTAGSIGPSPYSPATREFLVRAKARMAQGASA